MDLSQLQNLLVEVIWSVTFNVWLRRVVKLAVVAKLRAKYWLRGGVGGQFPRNVS